MNFFKKINLISKLGLILMEYITFQFFFLNYHFLSKVKKERYHVFLLTRGIRYICFFWDFYINCWVQFEFNLVDLYLCFSHVHYSHIPTLTGKFYLLTPHSGSYIPCVRKLRTRYLLDTFFYAVPQPTYFSP